MMTADTETFSPLLFPVKRKTSKITESYKAIEFSSDKSISNEAETPEEFNIVTDDGKQPPQMSMAVY